MFIVLQWLQQTPLLFSCWMHLGTDKSGSVAGTALLVLFNLSDIGGCFQKKLSVGCFGALHLF